MLTMNWRRAAKKDVGGDQAASTNVATPAGGRMLAIIAVGEHVIESVITRPQRRRTWSEKG
jgi:hypothetical protein